MAERRMFTRKITDDDRFMNLSASAQALYLHLSMNADDDGFCNQVAVQMFRAHASVHDLESLLSARFIYQFESGVIVIKHWRMANALRKDRYTATTFKEELSKLSLDENGAYTMNSNSDGCHMVANWLPDGCQMDADCLPQDRLGKDRLGKDSIGESKKSAKRFAPPSVEEVKAYCEERNNSIDPEHFVDYYSSNGWMVGKSKMKDWKSAIRNWERNNYSSSGTQHSEIKLHGEEDVPF